MRDLDIALKELDIIATDACAGKLSEAECKKRIHDLKSIYGNDLLIRNSLNDLKDEPANKEKLRKLRIIRAEGGTSEEVLIEMARTGRTLKQKKAIKTVLALSAVVVSVIVVITVISRIK